MEVETMLEDDLFFAELSKRISLLITDDDDDADDFAAAAHLLPRGHGFGHVPQQRGASMLAPPAYTLFHQAASYGGGHSTASAMAWRQQQQCGSKGTGVFIPRSTPGATHHRKKGKSKNRGPAASKARAAQAGNNALAAGAPAKRRA